MIGQTISHYKILEKLGEGGMGVVYKAQDTKLDRFVALKFLPPHLAASEQDKARFIQEAKVAAALNHPNICSIIDIQEHDDPQGGKQMFLVMEFVDGQTLQEKKGTLTQKQAIDYAIQIAEGLAAAHEKGIVHRDIKPENIMIRKDGIVQVMDFGLAKLAGVSRLTKQGSTVGTLGYMSPEQVQGQDTDHRSDIFSFGVLFYEMLTGRSPFNGAHESAILYEIVNVDVPPMSTIKPEIDAELDRIVLECLEKEPSERYQSIAEVAKELRRFKRESTRTRASRVIQSRPSLRTSALQTAVPNESSAPSLVHGSPIVWIGISALFFLISVTLLILYFGEKSPERQVFRFSIPPPQNTSFQNTAFNTFTVSPDGRMVACITGDSVNKNNLWVRPLNEMVAQRLAGTADALLPFWSPDSRFIGFVAGGKLKKISASGGPALTLCDAAGSRGGTWNNDGVIVFSPGSGPLYRVSASGGVATQLTNLDTARHEVSHRFPFFLPDGNHFLYYIVASGAESGVFVGSLDGKTHQHLVNAASFATYAQGYILYLREQTLMAQPFDESGLTLKHDAFPLAEDVATSPLITGSALFSTSLNGVLLYQPGSSGLGLQAIWYDRSGRQTGSVGEPDAFTAVRISPDGRQVAASLADSKTKNDVIWIYDLARGIRTRFTSDPNRNWLPVWSPDGNNIVFVSDRNGNADIYKRPSNRVSPEEPLLQTPADERPADWSRDGKFIMYFSLGNSKTGADIGVLPVVGDRKPVPFLQTEFDESSPRFSPDTRWVGFTSNESGKNEVYVVPFPGPGAKYQISISGGTHLRWRRDGKEVYFISPEGKVMAAEVKSAGAKFEVGKVQSLFEAHVGSFTDGLYDVSADGRRFLIITAPEGRVSAGINVVVNWEAEAKKQ